MTRISVIIPCKDERTALATCLDALDQQDLPRNHYEIIVIDGHSTDGCLAMAKARGARVLAEPARGPAAARNAGIRIAQSPILAFTDADCVPRYDWLTRILDAFHHDPTLAGVAGSMRLPRDTLLGRLEDNDARLHYHGYITSNIAYRRDILLHIGGFDPTLPCAEDYDLAWRILDAGHRIAHDPNPTVLHDPPEIRSDLATYLRKQYWYARHDIPAHARALQRTWHANSPLPGSTQATTGLLHALHHSAWTLATLATLHKPHLLAATLTTITLATARRITRTTHTIGEGTPEIPTMTAIHAAKTITRGAGTLTGLAELALRPQLRLLDAPRPARAMTPARDAARAT